MNEGKMKRTLAYICRLKRALALLPLAFGVPCAATEQSEVFKDSCGATEAFFEPLRETVAGRRAKWLAKAEAAKPCLHRRSLAPVRLVKTVASANAFQGWAVADAGAVSGALNRPLSPGDEFIFDFGEHIVGRLSVELMDFGRAVDAPVRLQFSFAEIST